MFRSMSAAAVLMTLATAAQAQQAQVDIDLSGIAIASPFNDQVRDSVNNPADGTPETIILSDGYRFAVEGTVTVTVFFVEFYHGPVAPLFNFLAPGSATCSVGGSATPPMACPPRAGRRRARHSRAGSLARTCR